MAGADSGQLRDVVSRWAASFVARLTGAATRAQLLVEEVAFGRGSSCNSLYRSVSTEEEEDDDDDDGDARRRSPAEFAEDDGARYESDQEQLLAEDDGADPSRARSVYCERRLGRDDGVGARAVSWARELRRRPSATTGDAWRCGDDEAAVEEAQSSEPLMLCRGAGERRRDRDD